MQDTAIHDRAPNTGLISFRCAADLRDRAEATAKAMGLSMAAIARLALIEKLSRPQGEKAA